MKTILFTGARSGIINKVIDDILDKGYKIYITVHTFSELKIVKEKYKNNKGIICFKLDIMNKHDRQKLIGLKIDILVCNAACGESGSMVEINMDKVRSNFEVNVFSNFELVQLVLKNMIKNKKGKIIMMGSLAGLLPVPFLGSYSATKASIIKMTESLNLELKLLCKNIKVSLILPGLYNTGFNKLIFDKKYDDMEIKSYFKEQINIIQKGENVILKLFQKNNFNSITKKIIKAITQKNPKFIYKAPFIQVIIAKIYSFMM